MYPVIVALVRGESIDLDTCRGDDICGKYRFSVYGLLHGIAG